jgi:hypothetical protein
LRRLATAFTITAAGTAAATATAQGAPTITISPAKPCYLTGERISASGGGFTPGGAVQFKVDDQVLGSLAADAAGNVAAQVGLPRLRGVTSHALSATDLGDPGLTAAASFMGTTNMVTVKPKKADAGTRLRLQGSGFLAGDRVYMHVRGRGYKSDKRVGSTKGPCGTFSKRTRIVPSGARSGKYRVQFDAKRRYSKRTTPRVVGTMTVTRRVRSSAARTAAAWARLPR